MDDKNLLQTWEDVTDNLAFRFAEKYFGKNVEVDWVAEDIGGVCVISDYFFNLGDMVDFMRYHYTRKKMFSYYNYALTEREKDKYPINIKNYLKLKK